MSAEPTQPPAATDASAPACATLFLLADLQDLLLAATNDLVRLETLLDDACATLLVRFDETTRELDSMREKNTEAHERALRSIAGSVTALQFQDLASQLISHTCRSLTYCTDRLASEIFNGDDEGEAVVRDAPRRANPVTQGEMRSGSIELF